MRVGTAGVHPELGSYIAYPPHEGVEGRVVDGRGQPKLPTTTGSSQATQQLAKIRTQTDVTLANLARRGKA